jgi:hypothetical protein
MSRRGHAVSFCCCAKDGNRRLESIRPLCSTLVTLVVAESLPLTYKRCFFVGPGRFTWMCWPPSMSLLFFVFSLSAAGLSVRPTDATETGSGTPPTPALICTRTNESAWITVSGLCHLLMYYRLDRTDVPEFSSGESMLRALTDERRAIELFGASPFIRTRNGVRYCLYDDPLSPTKVGEAHRDQCLATFSELHLPLSTPLRLIAGTYTVRDVLSEAVASFDINQKEPAWTAISLTRYLPPQKEWVNRFGKRTNFSDFARRLLRTDSNEQSCGGTHILESLGLISEADRRYKILDQDCRKELTRYINSTFLEIIQRQQPDGGWNKQWCSTINNGETGRLSPHAMRVLVTGHLLGILREIDKPSTIPSELFERGAAWLASSLKSQEIYASPSWLCPIAHASVCIRYQNENAQMRLNASNILRGEGVATQQMGSTRGTLNAAVKPEQ